MNNWIICTVPTSINAILNVAAAALDCIHIVNATNLERIMNQKNSLARVMSAANVQMQALEKDRIACAFKMILFL